MLPDLSPASFSDTVQVTHNTTARVVASLLKLKYPILIKHCLLAKKFPVKDLNDRRLGRRCF